MSELKVTRRRVTDEMRLAEVREKIAKRAAALEEAETEERTLLAEIKAKRDALDKLVAE